MLGFRQRTKVLRCLQDSFQIFHSRTAAIAALVLLMATCGWSSSYKVLYNFNNTNANPSSGLTIDAQGNAYGTTSYGGYNGAGTVYELSPSTGYHLLFKFGKSIAGGAYPVGNMVLDSAGNLYGTTSGGGTQHHDCDNGCGIVFKLSPPNNGGLWTENVIYSFCQMRPCLDGGNPYSSVIFDSTGNLYGTTYVGGRSGHGTVFELSPTSDSWVEKVLYSFGSGSNDGLDPQGGLIFDSAGNLYGTTVAGGDYSVGSVFELSPAANSWTETVLYSFGTNGSADGEYPQVGVTIDQAGNIFGTTEQGGAYHDVCNGGCGTVFELMPSAGGGWTETVIHTFAPPARDGGVPQAGVVIDATGNVYGTTVAGGAPGCADGCGTVYMLTLNLQGAWEETLFRFPDDKNLGTGPAAPVTLGAGGEIYGTADRGGMDGDGVVFLITP